MSEAPYWVPKNLRKTVGGQLVGLTPLKCECEGASDYCMHCGRLVIDQTPCSALEERRLALIPDDEVAAFGCRFETSDIEIKQQYGIDEEVSHCEKWCHRPACPFSLKGQANDE